MPSLAMFDSNLMFKKVIAIVLTAAFLCSAGCANIPEQKPYGVFLSVTDDLSQFDEYHTVVVDCQFYEAEEIEEFKRAGHEVYSYINIGSLEN